MTQQLLEIKRTLLIIGISIFGLSHIGLTIWTHLSKSSLTIGTLFHITPAESFILSISSAILICLYHLNLTQKTPLIPHHHLLGILLTASLWIIVGSTNMTLKLIGLEIGTLTLVISHFKGQRRAKKLYLILWVVTSFFLWICFLIQTQALQFHYVNTNSLDIDMATRLLTSTLFLVSIMVKTGHPPFQFPFDLMSKSNTFFFSASFLSHRKPRYSNNNRKEFSKHTNTSIYIKHYINHDYLIFYCKYPSSNFSTLSSLLKSSKTFCPSNSSQNMSKYHCLLMLNSHRPFLQKP